MTDIIQFPGTGAASKKAAGTALITATLDRAAAPLCVAGRCRDELRGTLQHVNDVARHAGNLPAAKFNHGRMLSRAALVSRTHTALLPIAYPHIVATPTITNEIALAMLSVLFGSVARPKGADAKILLGACLDMFGGADDIGRSTGLWRPVSTHPAVLALAIRRLINTSIFTSAAELLTAMAEARGSVARLVRAVEEWAELLRCSDLVLFEHDREAWGAAYARVGTDIVREMMDPDEEGYDGDDGEEDIPPSPRWAALEAMITKRGDTP